MPLPRLNDEGDMAVGVYDATMSEVVDRFGGGTLRRQAATARLLQIFEIARATGKLDRMILFGSYITAKTDPNDVDVVLVMRDDFEIETCDAATRVLFDHAQAEESFGASVFWIRPAMLLLETLEEFMTHWQVKLTESAVVLLL